MNTNTHIFALYDFEFHKNIHDSYIEIKDSNLIHRITRVLRLTVGDIFLIFDRNKNAKLTIQAIDRFIITCVILSLHDNKQWGIKITFFLPLLKRESLESAIYGLVEAGVQEIQLIKTEKVQRGFSGKKEMERLERILIAAAEQSKNFSFPYLKDPIAFDKAIELLQKATSYVGDPAGKPIFASLCAMAQRADHYALLVGPEGDFSPREWALLKQAKVMPLQLGPIILRAETAAFYLAALFRSRITS